MLRKHYVKRLSLEEKSKQKSHYDLLWQTTELLTQICVCKHVFIISNITHYFCVFVLTFNLKHHRFVFDYLLDY